MKCKLIAVGVFICMVLTACAAQTAGSDQTSNQTTTAETPVVTTPKGSETTDVTVTDPLPETDPPESQPPATTPPATTPPATTPPATTPPATTPPVTDPPVTEEPPAEGDAPKASEVVGRIPASSAADPSWFDDAAFIGDSVSLKLKTYCLNGALGKADFFTVGSYSTLNALKPLSDGGPHPSYQGEKMLSEDCVQKSGAKKVYIMLGMNDLSFGIDDAIDRYQELIGNILEKSPEADIFVQSMTPMTSTSTIESAKINNTNIKAYNQRLETMCDENGWFFVDVASVMYNDSGMSLRVEYCSDPIDMGVHFTSEGCKKWVEYLLTHTVDYTVN